MSCQCSGNVLVKNSRKRLGKDITYGKSFGPGGGGCVNRHLMHRNQSPNLLMHAGNQWNPDRRLCRTRLRLGGKAGYV